MQANSQSSSRVQAPTTHSDNEGSLGDGTDSLYEPEHESTDSSFEDDLDDSVVSEYIDSSEDDRPLESPLEGDDIEETSEVDNDVEATLWSYFGNAGYHFAYALSHIYI